MSTFNYITNSKKVKINLEFSGKNVSLELEPYRPIKFIKEKAAKIFYPCNFELKIIHINKDLTPFENVSIGDYFKNKNIISLKLVHIISLNSEKTNPTLKKEHIDVLNTSGSDKLILCKCDNEIISYYCRICNVFLCRNCRMNERHQLHLSVHVDTDNLEESIKLYAISLQADIKLNIKTSKQYSKNFQSEKLVDPTSRKEMIVRKLDEIERKQETFMQNLPIINDDEIQNILNNFDQQGNDAHIEIEKIIENIYYNYSKKLKKITYEETEKYFSIINNKEKEIENFNYNVLSYKVNFQVNKKIDEMYKIIERAIDAVLLSDMSKWTDSENDSMTIDLLNSMKKNIVKSEEESKCLEINLNNVTINKTLKSQKSSDSKNKNKKTESKIKINDNRKIKKDLNPSKISRISIEAINKDEIIY